MGSYVQRAKNEQGDADQVSILGPGLLSMDAWDNTSGIRHFTYNRRGTNAS
jgi:hypothetical protein